MSDEDHKLTVETETVEAPGESLLPSTIQPQSITTNENSNENGNMDYDNITTATTMTGMNNSNNNVNDNNNVSGISNNNVNSTNSNMNSNANNGSSNANTNMSTNGSTAFRDISPAHFAAAHAAAHAATSTHQPSSATEANFNLIDHNPLSPHAIQSLKNKKSSLLINNDGKKESLPNNGNLSTSELSRRSRNDDLEPSQMAAGGQQDQRVPQSSHSAKAATAPPAPPKQNANLAGPPMIQRPSLPLMNSREILLENEKQKSGGCKPKESKEPERAPTNPTNSHTDNVAASAHNEEDTDSLHKPTKADFFAARLASAVGENDISDSEETFIYESAANSTKNAVPSGVGNNSINDNSYNKYPDSAQHGVASKMSVPVLNNNAKLLNRLKSTRHTSLSALPANPSMPFSAVAPTPSPIANTGTGITAHPSTDDLNSVKSFARQNQRGPVDLQSVKSFSSEPRSPDKRMSLVSLAKGNSAVAPVPSSRTNTGPQQPQQPQLPQLPQLPQQPQQYPQQLPQPQQQLSRKPSISNSTLRHVSASHMGVPRAKPEPTGFKRKLRTTASKIFDANGAPLRRYSGVPDDVNLEDYIEQHPSQDTKRLGHDLGGIDDQQSTIQEEAEAAAAAAAAAEYGGDVDGDDIQSMFFYNHHGNLEARPQISDYEEDGEDLENNNNPNNNNGSHNHQSNGNTTYLNAPYGGNLPYANEYTPLKPKTHHARTTLGYSPHNFYTRKTSWAKFKSFIYFSCVTCMLLTVGFVLGFLLASNKELQDFNIVLIDNVLSSADELIFDVTVSALNPGFLSIDVQNVDLDIFAKSSHVQEDGIKYRAGSSTIGDDDDDDDPPNQKETVLLGTAYMLETPLRFHGNVLLKRDYDVGISSIKLLDPGAKQQQESDTLALLRLKPKQLEDDVSKWKNIIKHDYQLIVRGNMRYKVPYGGAKSVPVQSHTEVKASP
ncbi:hypothetical protein ZYGR_0A00810 [Zygosaccharomyces rouxii]|uniref:Vacuolar segregation protein 7 n=1 Tax=Zygosaccharomyces rouxii TaxID=4956 RepID=A0A1Q2ZSQ6_ZYGRO|nr:hypothetical protein ZYGR_0A00810 [Zygosaccharomyces rouxii]